MGTISPRLAVRPGAVVVVVSQKVALVLKPDGWDFDEEGPAAAAVGGRKVEKLTVLLFPIQSLDEMEQATMGNEGGGGDDDDDVSGGSGLGATDGTSAVAEVAAAQEEEAALAMSFVCWTPLGETRKPEYDAEVVAKEPRLRADDDADDDDGGNG